MSKLPIRIVPITLGLVSDENGDRTVFKVLASIAEAAFENTNRVAFSEDKTISLNEILFGQPTEAGRLQEAEKFQTKIRDDPTFRIFVAVTPNSQATRFSSDTPGIEGEIVSFAAWHFYEEPQPAQQWVDQEWPHARCPTALNDFFASFMTERNRFMGGKRYAHLDFFATLPSYQRQGIGKQLLYYGLLEAHRRGLPTWLEASIDGYRLYRSVGFEDVSEIDIDLARYGSKGIVRHVCMIKPLSSSVS